MQNNPILFLILVGFVACQNNQTAKKETPTIIDKKSKFQLEDKLVEIELIYYGMMCHCPQWATKEGIEKYETAIRTENEISMDSLFIRIEPENKETINPFDLDYKEDLTFKFTGRFYKVRQNWITEEGNEFNCKVLKYINCQIQN